MPRDSEIKLQYKHHGGVAAMMAGTRVELEGRGGGNMRCVTFTDSKVKDDVWVL